MGTWGTGTLDNDAAVGWLRIDYAPAGVSAIDHAFDVAIEAIQDGYIETPEAGAALGCAEVVAACHGRPLTTPPSSSYELGLAELQTLADTHAPAILARSELVPEAITICTGVVSGPSQSEIMDGWESSADVDAFVANVTDLRQRLESVQT